MILTSLSFGYYRWRGGGGGGGGDLKTFDGGVPLFSLFQWQLALENLARKDTMLCGSIFPEFDA